MDAVKEPLDELLEARVDLHGALRAFFSRRVPPSDVDDLVQECYLRVSQGIGRLERRERIGAWIFKIARNLVIDQARRERHEVQLDAEPLADEAVDAPALDHRLASWVAAMVERLPPNYAAAVRGSELEGRPHREIAERLGLSVSAVKSRVQRGRALLRGMLLACCTLEFDRRGGIHGYRQNQPGSCGC